jgi:hypothetical protein
MLDVQKYLQNHTLNQLSETHGVYGKIKGHKFSLNYDQIEARESDKLAQQCRGLVLHHTHSALNLDTVVGDTKIMAYPFNRFFNYGQEAASKIDFKNVNNLKFFEKLDGTCIIFYFDYVSKKWCVATRSVSEADIKIDGHEKNTFTSLFQSAIFSVTGLFYEDWLNFAHLNEKNTYIFELTSPFNRIVVDYKDFGIHLLGARNNETLLEINPEEITGLQIPVCPSYKLNNLNEMLQFVASRNALEHEGIVVCDNEFRRIKIKNPEYMAYNRIKDVAASSPRAILQIVLAGKLDDFTTVLPIHILELGNKYQTGLSKIIKKFNHDYKTISDEVASLGVMSDKVTQKQFAQAASRDGYWTAPMMAMYNKKCQSIQEYFDKQKDIDGNYKKSFLEILISKIEEN